MSIDTQNAKDIKSSGFNQFLYREPIIDPRAKVANRSQLALNIFTQADLASLAGDLLPSVSSVFDVGSVAKRWRQGHFTSMYIYGLTAGYIKAVGDGSLTTSATVPIAELGTGTAYRTLYLDSTGTIRQLAHGVANTIYTSNGASANPSWQTLASLGVVVGTAYQTVQEEGSSLTQRATLNFIGGGITAADDAGNTRTNVTLDTELNALASVTSAADKLPYFTGAGTATTTDLTTFGRSLIDDAANSNARTTLGLVIGTDVEAHDATLTALAAYNTNGLLTQTAADTFAGRTVTGTSNRISLSNGNGVSGNPTIDIDAAYVGQASITTLGTISTGTWSGTVISLAKGGTGAVLVDPNADRIMFWDDSAGAIDWLTAGSGLTISGTTITSTGITWTEVTGTSQSMAVNNAYIASNVGLVTLTIPDIAAVGSTVRVVGKGAGGWRIAQNSGETINFISSVTTSGTGGHIDSTNRYDCVELVCITADTVWVVATSTGTISIT